MVLIETLWNVKSAAPVSKSFRFIVLIETLWNVKRIAIRSSFFACKVLIETLWNVKISDNVYVRV